MPATRPNRPHNFRNIFTMPATRSNRPHNFRNDGYRHRTFHTIFTKNPFNALAFYFLSTKNPQQSTQISQENRVFTMIPSDFPTYSTEFVLLGLRKKKIHQIIINLSTTLLRCFIDSILHCFLKTLNIFLIDVNVTH